MQTDVKVTPVDTTGGSGPGMSGEVLTDEQVSVLKFLLADMAQISDQNDADPAISAVEKAVQLRWGGDGLQAIKQRDDADESEEAELPDTDPDPADLKVLEAGRFQGMSLRGSLQHLCRKGKCSLAEVQRMSLEPARNVAIFLESRKAMPPAFQDGKDMEEQEAEATYERFFPKAK